jgi:AmiR/NasT family two-component response regulator
MLEVMSDAAAQVREVVVPSCKRLAGIRGLDEADLNFNTRVTAEQAPRVLHEELRIQIAVGIMMSRHNLTSEEASERLCDAALRAGTTEVALAEQLIAGTGSEQHDE